MYLRKTCRKTTNSAHHKTKVILYILEVGIFLFHQIYLNTHLVLQKNTNTEDWKCVTAFYQSIFLDVQHLANFADMQFRQTIDRRASASIPKTNVNDIGTQSDWHWAPIHTTLAFKVNAIENTQNHTVFSKAFKGCFAWNKRQRQGSLLPPPNCYHVPTHHLRVVL